MGRNHGAQSWGAIMGRNHGAQKGTFVIGHLRRKLFTNSTNWLKPLQSPIMPDQAPKAVAMKKVVVIFESRRLIAPALSQLCPSFEPASSKASSKRRHRVCGPSRARNAGRGTPKTSGSSSGT